MDPEVHLGICHYTQQGAHPMLQHLGVLPAVLPTALEGYSPVETSPGTAAATWYPMDEPWALWASVHCIGTPRQEKSNGETSARD